MKRSEELKIQRKQKIDAMQSIVDAAKTEGIARALTADEQTKYDEHKREAAALQTQIDAAIELERELETTPEPGKSSGIFTIGKRSEHVFSVGKAIREYARGNSVDGLTGLERETHVELSKGIESSGLLIPTSSRAITANDTTTNADQIDVKIDPALSILGKEPMWMQMGATILPGLQGTIKLGKKTPDQATKVAEKTDASAESNVPSFVTLAPERFAMTDLFTKHLLASSNPAVQAAIVNDMIKGCDRALTAELYTVALAAATEVAAGDLTVPGFNALMAAVDGDGAFAMDRGSFFEAKIVPIDAGSGRFLAAMNGKNGFGVTADGVPLYYSTLFADGANKQYVVYGDWSEMWVGLWDAVEVLLNPFTYQKSGEIEMTVNRLADAAVRNSAAFVKSPDLDAA